MSLPQSFSRWFDPNPILQRLDEADIRGETIDDAEIHGLMYLHHRPAGLEIDFALVEPGPGIVTADFCSLLRVTSPTWTCFVDAPVVRAETLRRYAPRERTRQRATETALRQLTLARTREDLGEWRLEFMHPRHNCMSFGCGFDVSRGGLIPGAPQLRAGDPEIAVVTQHELLRGTAPTAWRIDHHLRAQGCIPVAALAVSQSPEFIARPDTEHPYYLISVIGARDDAHVMRCFYHAGIGQPVWMECLRGDRVIQFVRERGDRYRGGLITGIPGNPQLFTRAPWDHWIGCYLVPTHHVTFFNEDGEPAEFVSLGPPPP